MILLKTLIEAVGGQVANADLLEKDYLSRRFKKPTDLLNAQKEHICFFFSNEYASDLKNTKAGALIVSAEFALVIQLSNPELWNYSAVIVCKDPYWAMARITKEFASDLSGHSHLGNIQETTIHPRAVVDSTTVIGHSVQIGPNVVIGANCKIGSGVVIYPGTTLAEGCELGDQTVLFSGVHLYEKTRIGKGCRIHSGVVLGADGFGYALKKVDGKPHHHEKIYHFGRVIIGDDVEIGANTTIDRGTFGDTIVENGAKIDNQVQIGHNCKVGPHGIVCGTVAMAGNSSTGQFSVLGGGAGLTNKVHVGDFAQVGGMTGVSKDVPVGGTSMGIPGRDIKDYFLLQALLNKMIKERKK